jgi:hypothetical protein
MWFYKHYLCINPAKIPLSMERAELLLLKMLEQLRRSESASQLMQNLRLLEAEILQSIPKPESIPSVTAPPTIQPTAEPEKEYAFLQINEADVERELEELKEAADRREEMSLRVRPPVNWKEENDLPSQKNIPPSAPSGQARTLTPPPVHAILSPVFRESEQPPEPEIRVQRTEPPAKSEVNREVNDAMSAPRPELAQRFMETPIRDLKKAIGINDRYRFVQELFAGDEAQFEQAIRAINDFSIYPEAEFWIRKELKGKRNWKADDPVVQQFDQLVKRRFT